MHKVGGYLAVAFGWFMGVGVLLNVGGPHSGGVLLFSFAVFSVAPACGGWWLLREAVGRAKALLAADRAWDSELLRLAERRAGSLSVAEVVTYADLDAAEAERRLDALCRRGLCELRVTNDGVVVYRFADPPTAAQKLAAQGVME
jgi:hypothetical protein